MATTSFESYRSDPSSRYSFLGGDFKYNKNARNSSFHSYVTTAPARSSIPTPGKAHGSFEKVRTNVSTTILWDEGKAARAALSIAKRGNLDHVAKHYPEAADQARLMYEKLRFHQQEYNKSLPDPLWMVEQSFLKGPAFAEEYSDARKFGRFDWLGMVYVDPPDPNALTIKMKSYYDSYDVGSFIFWTEESEDYKWMLMGVPDSDPDYLDLIRYHCSRISKATISDSEMQEDIPISHLNRPIASAGFDASKPDEPNIPEWLMEFNSQEFDGEMGRLLAKRSKAPKKPGETRDIGILDPRSLRRQRRFMWLLQRSCTRLHTSPHGKDRDALLRILAWLDKDRYEFYMRDYTKSGMTVPHAVIRAVFEGFYERRPELGEMAARWYEDGKLWFKDTGFIKPETGAPLGLFVEGYTILQYAIHEINMTLFSKSYSSAKFSATNDDMVVSFKYSEDAWEYQNIDHATNSQLGMVYKDTKSGVAHNAFVYCEEYMIDGTLQPKDSLYAAGVLSALVAVNVVQAKDLVYSVLMNCPDITDRVMTAVKLVQSNFEPEFDEQEVCWPYLFGGWLPQYKSGIDYSYDWYTGDVISCAAYWACREDIHMPREYGVEPSLTIGRQLAIVRVGDVPAHGPYGMDFIMLFGDKETLKRHYLRSSVSPKVVAMEYKGLMKKRFKAFNNYLRGTWELQDPAIGWLRRHPHSVIRPNMPGLKKETVLATGQRSSGLPYDTETFKIAFLACSNVIVVGKDTFKDLRPTHVKLMSKKYTHLMDEFNFQIPATGLSQWVLSNLPRGLQRFYEDYGYTVGLVDADDVKEPSTALWVYSSANLVKCIRYWNWYIEKTRGPVPEHAIMWLAEKAEILRQRADSEVAEDPVPPEFRYNNLSDEEELAKLKEYLKPLYGQIERWITDDFGQRLKESLGEPENGAGTSRTIPKDTPVGLDTAASVDDVCNANDLDQPEDDFDYSELLDGFLE